MAAQIFKSTDASAPSLTKANGTLVSLLDAILVSGYGAVSPLGWSTVFTATNKRVYQPAAGTGFQLRVDDSGNDYEAKVRGGTFSDVDTLSADGFPTAAQLANGVFWQKTNTSAGARPWVAIGDAKRFFILIQIDTGQDRWNGGWFGDFESYKSGDVYNCLIIGKAASVNNEDNDTIGLISSSGVFGSAPGGHYVPRAYTGVGSAIALGKYSDERIQSGVSGGGTAASSCLTYPDTISGGLHVGRFFLSEPSPTFSPRGYLPGLWSICHSRTAMNSAGVSNGDTFSGANGVASRTFEFRHLHSGSANAIALETSDWPET